MNTRTFLATIFGVMLLAATGVQLVGAQGGPGGGFGPGRMHGGHGFGDGGPGGFGFASMLPRLAERLGLSEEQQAEINAILEEERPAIEALREQMAANREAHREAMVPGEFDEAAIRAHAEAQAALGIEMAVATARVKSRLFAVLTAEQQQQLIEMREQRQACRGMGGGRFGR